MKKQILSIDFTIVITVLLLMTAGYIALTSATTDTRRLTVQAFCLGLGVILLLTLCFWDYNCITEQKMSIYFMCIFLLAIVFPFGIGKAETGAISWIRFGGIGVQPSEFVKIIFTIYLSCELSELIERNSLNKPKELLKLIAKTVPIIALVILQNDTGTALVFIFILVMMLFLAGISVKYIFIFLGAGILLLPVIWFLLADYQRARIITFLNPNANLSDSGYQVHLAKLALSSGGILGKGYNNGAVNALSFLPEKETDFIFSVIGEEFGLIGTTFLVTLFLTLIFKCFSVAKCARYTKDKLIASGISAMLTFHIFENVGMTLGLLPVTGIPLPFLSYGGSSVLAMSISVGLLLSIRRKTYLLLYS